MSEDSKRRRCSCCGKTFKSRGGCDDHIRDVHAGEAERVAVKRLPIRDTEPSMASLFIEAEMNRAMGIPNEDWIADMLP